MPKVRLLELRNTYKWGGGPDKTILLSAERHDPNRVTVVVSYIRDVRDTEFQITQRARDKGLTFYELPERGKFDWRVLKRLQELIIKHEINIVHAHDFKSDLFGYLVRFFPSCGNVTLVSTAHGWAAPGPRGNLYRKLDLFLMKKFDRLIAVSDATKKLMIQSGIPESRIQVIYNGIDTKMWVSRGKDAQCEKDLDVAGAFPIIGYVGRITPEKDLETWLHVSAKIHQEYSTARFIIIGEGKDGILQKRLERQVAELGLTGKVVFGGYRGELQPLYELFDVFLLTSDREGLPNCILEAMAMSVPVVTTQVGGAPELVVPGKTGYLFPVADVKGLSGVILDIVRDKKHREDLGGAGRRRVETHFSFTKRMEEIESFYERLVTESV